MLADMAIPAMPRLTTAPTISSYARWQAERGDRNIVVRQGVWKGVWNVDIDTFELYDLYADPGEKSDLSPANPERVAEFLDYARQWYAFCSAQSAEAPTVEENQLDEETIRRLRTLGYVE